MSILAIEPRVTQSEYPFRVQCYQFKALSDARKFSKDLSVVPKTGHRDKVEMFHRRLQEVRKGDDGTALVQPITLDVTNDEPEAAEAKYDTRKQGATP